MAAAKPTRKLDSSDLMSVPQWAKRLGIGTSTAYTIIAGCEVDTVNVGSARRPRIRITEEAHHRFLEQRSMSRPKLRGRWAGHSNG